MTTVKTPSIWSKDSLIIKAQRYTDIMRSHNRDDWQFGLWSALSLEMLAKAALSHVSPLLIADGKDWNNLYFALGHMPSSNKFSPKSLDISEVLKRLKAINPEFTDEMLNFSIAHMNRRNSELHSGELPFDGLGTSAWLAMYFLSCEVLLSFIGEDLSVLFGDEEAETAKTLITSFKDKAAKAVKGTIDEHKTVWNEKSDKEKDKLIKQAEAISTRHIGHRINCPSCGTVALLQGSPTGSPTTSIENDLIVERQSMLPSIFECTACGLKINGFSKLNACGLGDSFTSTYSYDAAEYFDIETHTYEGMEPDFNEY